MNVRTKQLWATGLSIFGSLGTVATAFLVRKAAMKEVQLVSEISKNEYLDKQKMLKRDVFRQIFPHYIPAAAVGLATITSVVTSTILSRKAEASIMSMAVLADQGWRKYKNQIKETLGIDKHASILGDISKKNIKKLDNASFKLDSNDRRELYFDEIIGFFQALPEDVISAYAYLNELLNTNVEEYHNGDFEGVTMLDFVVYANANVLDKTITDEMLASFGWSMDYLMDVYDEMWVHMLFSKEVTDDGEIPYKVIGWNEDPILLDIEDYEERFDVKFPGLLDVDVEYATLEMFGLTKDDHGNIRKLKHEELTHENK